MADIDTAFFFAVWALGFGLSLATYRSFARHHGWPMGVWHVERRRLPVLVGTACIAVAVAFAAARLYGGHETTGWAIPLFGVAWAIFWTGFLRAGAQSALLLGPIAAAVLLVMWLSQY